VTLTLREEKKLDKINRIDKKKNKNLVRHVNHVKKEFKSNESDETKITLNKSMEATRKLAPHLNVRLKEYKYD
jgi:hypothetical protein